MTKENVNMVLVSNGIVCSVLVQFKRQHFEDIKSYDLLEREMNFRGFCITVYNTAPNSTSLSHAAGIADSPNKLPEEYIINTKPSDFAWAKDVSPDSELYQGVMQIIMPESLCEKAPEINLKKLATIKELLETLSAEEIKTLTGQ